MCKKSFVSARDSQWGYESVRLEMQCACAVCLQPVSRQTAWIKLAIVQPSHGACRTVLCPVVCVILDILPFLVAEADDISAWFHNLTIDMFKITFASCLVQCHSMHAMQDTCPSDSIDLPGCYHHSNISCAQQKQLCFHMSQCCVMRPVCFLAS
jgi:hypothetical protein